MRTTAPHGPFFHCRLGKSIDSHWFKMSCLTCLFSSYVYCFFLKRWNYIKIWISRTSAEIDFFLINWHHKRIKNTIDLLLFYGEHFYGFLEIDLWKHREKKFISKQTSIYMGHIHFEVLWSSTVNIAKVFFIFKTQSLCLYSSKYA